jgi:hypothetical protein
VIQTGRDPGLADESLAERLVVGQVWGEDLQGHLAPEAEMLGEVDDARAAPADHTLDPMSRELGPDAGIHPSCL